MGKAKGVSNVRTRNFAFLVYPDSACSDWISRLDEEHVPAFVSPLHDSDVNPDGEIKKAHYHVMILFDSVKTIEQANELYERVVGHDGFVGNGCDIVGSVRAYARYLCHLDNGDKFQYSISSVRCFGGADYHFHISSSSDRFKTIREMRQFIRDNRIIYFSQFFDYCADNREDWFQAICTDSAYIVKEYMRSLHFELENRVDD